MEKMETSQEVRDLIAEELWRRALEKRDIVGKQIKRKMRKIQRNERCPCGSGKKFKKCCRR